MRRLAGEHRGGLKIATTPWQRIGRKKRSTIDRQRPNETKRQFPARCVEETSSFKKVPFEDGRWWEDLKRRDPKMVEKLKTEFVSFRIDWKKPLPQVEKDAPLG